MKRLWLTGIALAIACGVAFAQPAAKVAEDHFNRGNTAYNLGRFDEAVEHFTKAYEAWPRPEFLYNIAQSYRLARNCKQSLHFYKRFRSLKEADTANPLSAKKREEVERFISQLTECAAKADTTANTQPDTIAQPDKGATPGSTATPAAGVTPTATNPMEAEEPETDESEDQQPSSSGGGKKVAGIVTAGAGLGLLVTGAVFGMMAKNAQSDVEDAVKNGQPFDPDLDAAGRRNATISKVTLGVGAAAVVTGGVLYFLGARSGKQGTSATARLKIVPTISTETAGLTLDVRY
jgi:tetratricopeptide (TPR) repeat protein